MKKEDLKSVIQSDFLRRLGSGCCAVHHVFPGSRRRTCEKYGFLVALTPEVHEVVHQYPNNGLDRMFKREAQRWYEAHISTREQFIKEFGRSYL